MSAENPILGKNTEAGNNTGIGAEALKLNTTGTHNTGLGSSAGDALGTGSQNVLIGASTDPSAADATNQTVIGYNSTGQADNSVTLGNADVTAVYMAQDAGATVHAAGITSASNGNITIDPNGSGTLALGSADNTAATVDAIAFSIDATGGASNISLAADGAADDLTVAVTGSQDASLVLSSAGTGADAVQLTASAGGMDISASSGVDFKASTIANFSASTVSITSAATLDATHNGKVLICNNSSDFNLTVPEDTLPAGFNCLIVQKGAGEITLAAASGNVTIHNRNSHEKTANQWAIMTLLCIDATTDANVFVSGGDGVSAD